MWRLTVEGKKAFEIGNFQAAYTAVNIKILRKHWLFTFQAAYTAVNNPIYSVFIV